MSAFRQPSVRLKTVFISLLLAGFTGLQRLHASGIDPVSSTDIQPFKGTPVKGYKLTWSDEFNGSSLDKIKWNYRTGVRLQSRQLPSNVSVSNGFLQIHLKKEKSGGKNYTAGGVISKTAFKFGYYEARMKTPTGSGWHTSFWMMPNGRDPYASSVELDAIENDSREPTGYRVNTHQWFPKPHKTVGGKHIKTPPLNIRYHVFGCEYTPTAIRYFFDGKLVQTVDIAQLKLGEVNIWLTSIAFPGRNQTVDETKLPDVAKFDYIRFFTNLE